MSLGLIETKEVKHYAVIYVCPLTNLVELQVNPQNRCQTTFTRLHNAERVCEFYRDLHLLKHNKVTNNYHVITFDFPYQISPISAGKVNESSK